MGCSYPFVLLRWVLLPLGCSYPIGCSYPLRFVFVLVDVSLLMGGINLHTRSSNTSVEHAPRETRGTMQLTDGRDRLNACNYDWPRKGPIAIVRSAARRGADRTARARCVQQTNINSLNFCLSPTESTPMSTPPRPGLGTLDHPNVP